MSNLTKKYKSMNHFTKNSIFSYVTVILAYFLINAMIAGGSISNSLKGQLIPICTYIVMAVSLNLVVGISGELSLGHAGFMSVGAFTGVVVTGVLGTTGIPMILTLAIAIIAGAIMALIFGVIVGIPVLKLRGDYLAIVTLAFGEIIKDVITLIYVGVDSAGIHVSFTSKDALGLAEDGKMLINGALGATGITKMSTFGTGIILILITLFIVYNIINSRSGRAIMAVRDNYIAAESVGINTTKYRLMAFAISAALAGAAGVLYGLNYSNFVATKFNFNTSILVLVFVVLGGMGNIFGSIIAATLLTVLPELLRSFNDYRMLIYAIVLILVMLVRNNDKIASMLVTAKTKLGLSRKKGGKNHV